MLVYQRVYNEKFGEHLPQPPPGLQGAKATKPGGGLTTKVVQDEGGMRP